MRPRAKFLILINLPFTRKALQEVSLLKMAATNQGESPDVKILADFFVHKCTEDHGKQQDNISPSGLNMLA